MAECEINTRFCLQNIFEMIRSPNDFQHVLEAPQKDVVWKFRDLRQLICFPDEYRIFNIHKPGYPKKFIGLHYTDQQLASVTLFDYPIHEATLTVKN